MAISRTKIRQGFLTKNVYTKVKFKIQERDIREDKDQDKVAGTASAASIWNTGAIGLAVAFDRYEIAILLAALNFLSLFIFGKIKEDMISEGEKRE